MREMTILVLGSEGHIGSALLTRLKQAGHRAIGVDRKPTADINADIRSFRRLNEAYALTEPDMVFHLAGEVGRENCEQMPDLTLESNLLGTLNVLQCCERFKAKLVYAGTSESYGGCYAEKVDERNLNPEQFNNIYGLSKWYAEKLVAHYHQKYAVKAVIVRYFMCYGPGEYPTRFRSFMARMIDNALHGRDITVHRDTSRSWCYIDDIVDGTIIASQYDKFDLFNIGNGRKELMTEALANHIIRTTNSKSNLHTMMVPPNVYPHKTASFEKAKALLGWEAAVDVLEGIRRTIEWQKSLLM